MKGTRGGNQFQRQIFSRHVWQNERTMTQVREVKLHLQPPPCTVTIEANGEGTRTKPPDNRRWSSRSAPDRVSSSWNIISGPFFPLLLLPRRYKTYVKQKTRPKNVFLIIYCSNLVYINRLHHQEADKGYIFSPQGGRSGVKQEL